MTETAKLLDRARERLRLTSDYQLAKALGWGVSTISSYRTGRRTMSVALIEHFSDATGIEIREVVKAARLDLASEKTAKPAQRRLELRISA